MLVENVSVSLCRFCVSVVLSGFFSTLLGLVLSSESRSFIWHPPRDTSFEFLGMLPHSTTVPTFDEEIDVTWLQPRC